MTKIVSCYFQSDGEEPDISTRASETDFGLSGAGRDCVVSGA